MNDPQVGVQRGVSCFGPKQSVPFGTKRVVNASWWLVIELNESFNSNEADLSTTTRRRRLGAFRSDGIPRALAASNHKDKPF